MMVFTQSFFIVLISCIVILHSMVYAQEKMNHSEKFEKLLEGENTEDFLSS